MELLIYLFVVGMVSHVYTYIHVCVFGFRFLDPDPSSLLSELSKSMGEKYHQLNKAIATLVSINNYRTVL